MSQVPSFIAYTVAAHLGRKPVWRRIGAAFPHDNGLAVLLNALPLGGRVILLEPKAANRCTVQFFPAVMPTDLATKPALRGEKRVWLALRRAPFPAGTRIFYNRAPIGCRRRADMLILMPQRGIIAIEVKGGRVAYRGGLRQRLSGPARGAKRIQPWGQAQRALAQALAALKLNPVAIPKASMLALPGTSADAFPFPPRPHMLTAEDLAPPALARKLEALLPRLDAAACAALAPALDMIAAACLRPSDKPRGAPPR